jgi:hypothetical protein
MNQVLFRIFNTFTDCIRNFGSFTDSCANPAIAIANDNQRAEADTTSAFYYSSYAINTYNFLC